MARFILDLNNPIEEQLDELNEVLSENDNGIRIKPFKVETSPYRVYGVNNKDGIYDYEELQDMPEYKFIELAEAQGYVWSLKGFEEDYNIDDIERTILIRIINYRKWK